MTTIGLLRHGEVQGGSRFRGHTDDLLTAEGFEQMRAATKGQRWDQVFTSPLQRCARFASEFSEQHSIPLTLDSRLMEMYFGAWEGRTAAGLMDEDPQLLSRFWADPGSYPPPGSEPLVEFQARVMAAWENVLIEYSGQRILLVTHAGVIRLLLCHIQQLALDHLLEFEVDYGSLRLCHIAGGNHYSVETIKRS